MRHEQNDGDGVDWGIDVRDQVCTPYTSFVDYYDDYLSSCNDDVATAFNATTSEWVKVIILAKRREKKKMNFCADFSLLPPCCSLSFFFFFFRVFHCRVVHVEHVLYKKSGESPLEPWNGRERVSVRAQRRQNTNTRFHVLPAWRRCMCVCVLRIAHCGVVGCGLQAYHTLTHAADNNSHNNLYLHNILPVSHSRIFIISHLFSWFLLLSFSFFLLVLFLLLRTIFRFVCCCRKGQKHFRVFGEHTDTHTRHRSRYRGNPLLPNRRNLDG